MISFHYHLEFSSQSLLLLYLFKECDAHRNDKSYVFEERYCLKVIHNGIYMNVC